MLEHAALFASAVFVTSAYVTVLVFLAFLLTLLIIPFITMPKKQEQSAKRVKIAEEFEPQPLEELVADYHRRLEKYGGKHASKPHIDVDSRIKALTEGLADPDRANQHENYKAALKMYKAGKSPNSTGWYFVKGKLYPTLPDGKNKPKGAPVHVEVWR